MLAPYRRGSREGEQSLGVGDAVAVARSFKPALCLCALSCCPPTPDMLPAAPLTLRRPLAWPVTATSAGDRQGQAPVQADSMADMGWRPPHTHTGEQKMDVRAGVRSRSSSSTSISTAIPHISWLQRALPAEATRAGFVKPPARPAQDRLAQGQAAGMVAHFCRALTRLSCYSSSGCSPSPLLIIHTLSQTALCKNTLQSLILFVLLQAFAFGPRACCWLPDALPPSCFLR